MSKPQRFFRFLSPTLLALVVTLSITASRPALALKMVFEQEEVPNCLPPKIPLDPHVHKSKYRIAVHAIRGLDRAMLYYNMTFQEYLTATAGQQFDPPIEFELIPKHFNELFQAVEEQTVDYFYANPGSYSCIGVEQGAQPLVTTISKVHLRGHEYDLDVFAGVIFTRADNKDVNHIQDLKDKVIGAGGLSVIMGGQAQLYEMVKAGMDYVMDPKQVVLTGNQYEVVKGVLNGEFEVGMVRTNLIEKTFDDEGNPIDPAVFKVLEPNIYVQDDGTLFPFLHSTEVFPEWPVAALTHAPSDVSTHIQLALLALEQHARPWQAMVDCQQALLEQVNDTTIYDDLLCDEVFWEEITRCDTTPEIARLAYQASQSGGIAGFRNPSNYFEVRTMHERAGFLKEDPETHEWKCIRSGSLHQSLTCPPEHYKLNPEDFDKACEQVGLACKEEYECYCKPCVKHFEVDVYQYYPENYTYLSQEASINHVQEQHEIEGCGKMSLCGYAEQREPIYLRAFDNRKRANATVTAVMHLGRVTHPIEVRKVGDFLYQMAWYELEVGVGIVEISVDGEQIPESPVRVQLVPRSCHLFPGGANRRPDDEGNCICNEGNVEIGGTCVTTTVLAVTSSLLAVIVLVISGYFIIRHKNYKNDLMWHVNADELRFDDPVEVIGEGAFGVVVLAEYRGTKVAIKRAVRAGSKSRDSRGSLGPGVGTSFVDDPKTRASSGLSLDADSGHISSYMGLSDDDTDTPSSKNDEENQLETAAASGVLRSGKRGSATYFKSKSKQSGMLDLGFLADLYGKGTRGRRGYANDQLNEALSIIVSSSGSHHSKTLASKMCPWFDNETKREEAFVSEMRLLSSLRHPCICTVMGAVMSRDYSPMLVMEYMEYGSLHDLLRNETMYLSGEIILQIMRDVAQGLRYLHTAKPPILHGDLKPANILIDSRFRGKVCDFGLSRKKKNTISGSLFWLPPEYLIGSEDYNSACDMYSMGIILNETYSRAKPYDGEDTDLKALLVEICDRRVNKRPVMPDTIPPRMAELVKKLWSRDPSARPPAKELDSILMDMNVQDAEPITPEQLNAKPRTQDMLYELFPKHVAEALKAGKKVEPETHELVTIVFSDIKGFTDISREISPLKVSMMLDRLYLAFDKIARKHGVFKVETIGDAYMGVTNLVEQQEDTHVKRIAEFAIDMINEAGQILIDEDEPTKGYIRIRVGFHSGPVVANVIGSLNPRYGLFGDSVNTASRMESNSSGSRILCSEASYMLLKRQAPDMPIQCRGKIPVKGKGDMIVYWVGDERIRKNKKKRRKCLRTPSLESGADVNRSDRNLLDDSMIHMSQSHPEQARPHPEQARHVRMEKDEQCTEAAGHESGENFCDEHESRETAITEESGMSDQSVQANGDGCPEEEETFCDEPANHAKSSTKTDESGGGDKFVRMGPVGRIHRTFST